MPYGAVPEANIGWGLTAGCRRGEGGTEVTLPLLSQDDWLCEDRVPAGLAYLATISVDKVSLLDTL